ncbi:hypothetical protein AGMMS50230_02150 [Spirochaetia bacterium]|nr:hypothetical protein AGMMS50230_02150 [Spirochaetia bacterium]
MIVFISTNALFNFTKEGRDVKAKRIILEKKFEINEKAEKQNDIRKKSERLLNKKEEYLSELKKTAEKDVNGYSKDGGIDNYFEKRKRLFIEIIEFLKNNGIEDISFTKQYVVDEPYIISPARDGGWNKVSKISLELIEKLMRIK